jgi:metal-responsive CopG/Arc/MetJ family transcriptional regulator
MTAAEKREKYGTMIGVRVSLDLHEQINKFREENGDYNWSAYIKECIIEKLAEDKNSVKQK